MDAHHTIDYPVLAALASARAADDNLPAGSQRGWRHPASLGFEWQRLDRMHSSLVQAEIPGFRPQNIGLGHRRYRITDEGIAALAARDTAQAADTKPNLKPFHYRALALAYAAVVEDLAANHLRTLSAGWRSGWQVGGPKTADQLVDVGLLAYPAEGRSADFRHRRYRITPAGAEILGLEYPLQEDSHASSY